MAAPIYFFPRVLLTELVVNERLASPVLKRYRLDDVLGDVGDITPHCRVDLPTQGPADASGCLFATNIPGGQPPVRFGYYPDFQDWHKVSDDPELWIGVDREHPPGPADLQRVQLVPGYKITLADGQQYEVPVIRSPNPGSRTNLPQDMWWDAAGEFQVKLKQQYQSLWDLTEPVWDFFYGEDAEETSKEIPFVDVLTWCLTFLGVNYRYGRMEHMVLRLIDQTLPVCGGVLKAAIDMPWYAAYEASLKKTGSP